MGPIVYWKNCSGKISYLNRISPSISPQECVPEKDEEKNVKNLLNTELSLEELSKNNLYTESAILQYSYQAQSYLYNKQFDVLANKLNDNPEIPQKYYTIK